MFLSQPKPIINGLLGGEDQAPNFKQPETAVESDEVGTSQSGNLSEVSGGPPLRAALQGQSQPAGPMSGVERIVSSIDWLTAGRRRISRPHSTAWASSSGPSAPAAAPSHGQLPKLRWTVHVPFLGVQNGIRFVPPMGVRERKKRILSLNSFPSIPAPTGSRERNE
jgi:hypothetical protein